ncbi:MAG: GTP-binding protein, partial [Gammaproteobacteria bacterium]|nr:GTP-binding protein [Gammaproteobacteria bacterium]
YEGEQFTLIDTAGVRRKGRIDDKIEKFSVIKTLAAIEDANVVILVLDAKQGISTQDAHLLGYAVDAGRALLIAVNKWDGMQPSEKERIKIDLERKLSFVDYASVHFISALHGSGVGKLMGVVKQAYQNAYKAFATNLLTRILEDAVSSYQPPLVNGRRIKLRYAHQGGKNPPIIVIHGNQTDKVPAAYARYLEKTFRQVLRLDATPIRIEFRSGENPFKAGHREQLTDREMARQRQLTLTRLHKRKKGDGKPRRKG